MIYVQRLLEHSEFRQLQREIEIEETDRIYCRHGFSHSLDVCRIAWILFLEENGGLTDPEGTDLSVWKERIYLTGLLHDIGRTAQYRTGEHHAEAGRRIAARMLQDIECPAEWRDEILSVVELHFGRDSSRMQPGSLGDYICRADHLSRNCFLCDASDTCKWKESEKNKGISE